MVCYWAGKWRMASRFPRGNVVERLLCAEDTQYSPWFDEKVFQSIPLGTPMDGALADLGTPLLFSAYDADGNKVVQELHFWGSTWREKDADLPACDPSEWSRTRYTYTCPGSRSDHFFIRELVLDKNGDVVEKLDGFYFD